MKSNSPQHRTTSRTRTVQFDVAGTDGQSKRSVQQTDTTTQRNLENIVCFALTRESGVSRVRLVPRGRTQQTPKDGVPVAAGEGTEESDIP